MTALPVIVDTNVVVAGFPLTQTSSPVLRILQGMLRNELTFVLSDALLAEYRDVLLRPIPRRLHGMNDADIDRMLAGLVHGATMVAPPPGPTAPDPGDQLLWDLLAARPDVVLVTQDKLLLDDATMRGRVVTPSEFMERN